MSKRIAVLGAGSWGTALSISLASAGHDVVLWARREEAAEFIRKEKHNKTYLPDAIIPDSIVVTSDLEMAAVGSDVWVFAMPSHAVRHAAGELHDYLTPDIRLVSVAKGIENETLMTTSQVLADVYPDHDKGKIAVLYGPSHAEEVAAGDPTAVVIASEDRAVASELQAIFMSPTLRVYVNTDVIGVEIAGSVKNILAIAAGMSDGVGYGDNAKAGLITRGLAEIRRFGVAMGARPGTFSGLAGIGDIVVTCMSKHSRNRFLGEEIGKGKSPEQVQSEMQMVAEGVRTTKSVHELARQMDVEMPITEAVYSILFDGKKPETAVRELMTRSAKHEELLVDSVEEVD